MEWWKRWIGRRPATAAPWSFPRRLDVIPGTLSMTVFDHEIQTLGPTIPCWTFVSDGLLGYGQKELVLTVARSPGEHPQAVAEEISKLLTSLQPLAAAGQLVDVGGVTVFNGLGPGGSRGLAYIRPEPLAGVDVPVSALTVIPLMAAEAEVAHRFGVARIMGRLARHYRHYPCPPWWDRGRTAVAASLGEDTSILDRLALGRVPGLSARMDPDRGLVLRLHPAAQEPFLQALAAAPRDLAFALLTDLDPEADGLFVWNPGAEGLEAATPEGSRGVRVSLCFIGFAVGVDEMRAAVVEDGALVSFTTQAWDALVDAVRRGQSLRFGPTASGLGLALDWVVTTYVSPVDGRAFGGDEAWSTFHPSESPITRRVLDGVVLLTNDSEAGMRVSVKALASYLDGIEQEFTQQFGGRTERTTIHVRVELRPGEPARVVGSGDLEEGRSRRWRSGWTSSSSPTCSRTTATAWSTEDRPAIRIWGDNGILCRPYVTDFPHGARWILALKREPGTRDYIISVCGDYWLEVRGDQAVGRITMAEHGQIKESAPLAGMLAWIRSGGATPLAPLPLRRGTAASGLRRC